MAGCKEVNDDAIHPSLAKGPEPVHKGNMPSPARPGTVLMLSYRIYAMQLEHIIFISPEG